jgi:hypothetical protein
MPRAVVGQRADELLRVLELDSADGTVELLGHAGQAGRVDLRG